MSPTITIRPSEERGNADHDWLKTFHTFSFAMYQDLDHESWGSLRVINEDRVQPGTGFGTHGHRDFEIFSYVVSGQLERRDSMGNVEILKRGDLQMTSAGTGIRHSEKTSGSKQVHFLQIWAQPTRSGLTPQYFTRHFTDAEKTDKLVKIVAPVGVEGVIEKRETSGPAPVHSPLSLYASIVLPSTSLSHKFASPAEGAKRGRGYIHVVQTSGYNTGPAKGAAVTVSFGTSTAELKEGDGAYLDNVAGQEFTVRNTGEKAAEVLLFDLE